MKINYAFANESVEVEVEEAWGELLMEMDRKEYNNEHKETRRHASLDEFNLDDAYLPSDFNLEDEILRKEEIKELVKALEILSPEQLHLVKSVYFEGKSMADIARSEGVSKMAITYRMKVVKEKIKKVSF